MRSRIAAIVADIECQSDDKGFDMISFLVHVIKEYGFKYSGTNDGDLRVLVKKICWLEKMKQAKSLDKKYYDYVQQHLPKMGVTSPVITRDIYHGGNDNLARKTYKYFFNTKFVVDLVNLE